MLNKAGNTVEACNVSVLQGGSKTCPWKPMECRSNTLFQPVLWWVCGENLQHVSFFRWQNLHLLILQPVLRMKIWWLLVCAVYVQIDANRIDGDDGDFTWLNMITPIGDMPSILVPLRLGWQRFSTGGFHCDQWRVGRSRLHTISGITGITRENVGMIIGCKSI